MIKNGGTWEKMVVLIVFLIREIQGEMVVLILHFLLENQISHWGDIGGCGTL